MRIDDLTEGSDSVTNELDDIENSNSGYSRMD